MQISFVLPGEVLQYLHNGAQFIDLRDREDYEKKHIKQARSMPYESFQKTYQTLPKNRTYVLYCERGATSMLAAKKMLAAGYDVKSLSGGIHGFWNSRKD